MWFAHRASRSHPSPHPTPTASTLCPCNLLSKAKQNLKGNLKTQNKQSRTGKKKGAEKGISYMVSEAVQLCSSAAMLRVSHIASLSPFVFICKWSLPESSIWFELSVLCHTINNGLSVGLPRDFPLLPCVVKILKVWIRRFIRFSCSNTS